MLVGDKVLVHYDSLKPIVLGVDASPYGLGAVLSHRFSDGSERPIALPPELAVVQRKIMHR